MAGRVEGKVAAIFGAGQTPGEGVGNGRATAILLGREGAKVVSIDRDLASAEETAQLIRDEGGEAIAMAADVVSEDDVRAAIEGAVAQYGRLDILHNNVGISVAAKDAPATELTVESFDRVYQVNLRGMWLTCKYALGPMREQRSGSIVNIGSMAIRSPYPLVAYKTTKAGVSSLTENLALFNAEYNIRVNCILPGLMNTPMAIENRVAAGADRAELIARRDSEVPLGGKMGTGWDIARAALFLHSDDASYITGIQLPVDGGRQLRNG